MVCGASYGVKRRARLLGGLTAPASTFTLAASKPPQGTTGRERRPGGYRLWPRRPTLRWKIAPIVSGSEVRTTALSAGAGARAPATVAGAGVVPTSAGSPRGCSENPECWGDLFAKRSPQTLSRKLYTRFFREGVGTLFLQERGSHSTRISEWLLVARVLDLPEIRLHGFPARGEKLLRCFIIY